MKRLAIPAVAVTAALLLPVPAQADNPYPTGDLSTLESCTWNYHRVVSIGEDLAHQLGNAVAARDYAWGSAYDLTIKLSQARAGAYKLDDRVNVLEDTLARRDARIGFQRDRIELQRDRITRQKATIARLRARLAAR